MRVRSHWFRSERPKTRAEIAGALAFIAWRVAQQVLRNMRRADFEIDPGPKYFDFLAEWLVFLVHVADCVAWSRFGDAGRVEFTSAMANRLAEIHADNRADLLGPWQARDGAGAKEAFIDLLNLRLADYTDFPVQEDADVPYGALRYLADHLSFVVGERDTIWVHEQVMEIEAPQAADTIRRGFRDLRGEGAPRPRRAVEAGE